jgi:biotin carboxyl carrier protein
MRRYDVSINSKQYSVVVKKYTQQNAELEINGKPYSVKLDTPITTSTLTSAPVQSMPVQVPQPAYVPPPQAHAAPTPSAAPAAAVSQTAASEVIKAPIPGSILDILVKVGDSVKVGQTVLKMEAMKMENDINTTGSGEVKAIRVSVGDAVNQGQELVVIG